MKKTRRQHEDTVFNQVTFRDPTRSGLARPDPLFLDSLLSRLAGYSNSKIFSFSGILKYNRINRILYNVIWKVFAVLIYTFLLFYIVSFIPVI